LFAGDLLMKVLGNTVLITGGGSGIGLALAKAFGERGNSVAICGRDESKLAEAQRKIPGLQVKRCDLTVEADREELIRWMRERLPDLNVLVNNAAIARKVDLRSDAFDFGDIDAQLATDLLAPIHLSLALLPNLRKQSESALVNVTTGLVYSPDASTPLYSAAKTGLHTWTQALRHQLRDTNVSVFEVQPPIVDTAMIRGLGITAEKVGAIPPHEVAGAVLKGMTNDEAEIRIGPTKALYVMSRIAPGTIYQSINRRIEAMSKRRAA
jgi:uncharacterized oxidoreductase